MKTYKFKKIDAFTDGSSSGNPAGCVEIMDNLSNKEMLQIAKELKGFVSEVGYVKKEDDIFCLKYYSSEREVEFCGHATIAIMYDMIKNDADLINRSEIKIEVNAGELSVFNKINEEDAVYIMAPAPEYLNCKVKKEDIAEALKTDIRNIDEKLPIEIINGGLKTLIIPINSIEECVSIYPNIEELNIFCIDNDIDIVHIYCKETYTKNADYRTRVFAPTFGYLEDPATGSGNAAFGCYLVKNNLWNNDITVEQSGNLRKPNFIKLKKYEANGRIHILFGGNAVKRIEGTYFLY